MKKLFILFALFSLITAPSFCVLNISSYFSSDFIMSDPLAANKTNLSANIEYCSLSEYWVQNAEGDWVWKPLNTISVSSLTLNVVPLRIAYGITDNTSIRLTIPYVTVGGDLIGGPEFLGIGIGDIRFEGLYEFAKESKESPAILGNISVKAASGKPVNLLEKYELPLGISSTDLWISAIFKKKIDAFTCKALLGYVITGQQIVDHLSVSVDPGDAIACSAAIAYPLDKTLEVGGEIWGYFSGQDRLIDTVMGEDQMIDDTETSMLTLTPFITYSPMTDVKLRGAIDIPVGQNGSMSSWNLGLGFLRGYNITVGASWTI